MNFDTGVAQRRDPATGKEQARVTIGSTGSSVAATPDGQVWTASFGDARVVRVEGDHATTRIAVGPGPEGLTYGFGALWTAIKGCRTRETRAWGTAR